MERNLERRREKKSVETYYQVENTRGRSSIRIEVDEEML